MGPRASRWSAGPPRRPTAAWSSFDARSDGRAGQRRRAAVPVPALRGPAPPSCSPAPRRENVGEYDQLVRDIIAHLDDRIHRRTRSTSCMAHLTVTGGAFGGGERAAQSIFEYHVPATAFPADAALRRARPPAPAPVAARRRARCTTAARRSRSTSASRTTPTWCCLVEVSPSTPAKITDVPITAGGGCGTVPRHGGRTRRPRRRVRRGLPAGLRERADQGRAAGRVPGRPAERAWRSASTRSSPRR